MTAPLFVDTGYLIGLLSADDEHHDAAVRWDEVVQRSRIPLVTSSAILLELGNRLARPKEWPRTRLFIDAMRVDPMTTVVAVDDRLLSAALDFRSKHRDKAWGLVDCTSFVIMQEHGIEAALTCDHHFQQARFKALLIKPEE